MIKRFLKSKAFEYGKVSIKILESVLK